MFAAGAFHAGLVVSTLNPAYTVSGTELGYNIVDVVIISFCTFKHEIIILKARLNRGKTEAENVRPG